MFSKEDFNKENAQRLSVIIMAQMRKPHLTSFRNLGANQQSKFNRLLNGYIQEHLQVENWEEKLFGDFNRIVNEDILNEDFDAGKQFVPIVITEPQILLTEDQKQFIDAEQ
jgi:hypothetical protein